MNFARRKEPNWVKYWTLPCSIIGSIAWKLLGTVITPKIENKLSRIGLSENEKAANGPLPGDVSLYAKELVAQQQIVTPGYYPSLTPPAVGKCFYTLQVMPAD